VYDGGPSTPDAAGDALGADGDAAAALARAAVCTVAWVVADDDATGLVDWIEFSSMTADPVTGPPVKIP
jgi:hypothetical protein